MLLGFSRIADLAIMPHQMYFQFHLVLVFFLGCIVGGFFLIEGHNTCIYINALKNMCPVTLQCNNSLKTKFAVDA